MVDAFIANMTRKSQMAVQEQELNKAKLKCESYKRTITTLQKQVTFLKSTLVHKLTKIFSVCGLAESSN